LCCDPSIVATNNLVTGVDDNQAVNYYFTARSSALCAMEGLICGNSVDLSRITELEGTKTKGML
jgi:hypothetical protein